MDQKFEKWKKECSKVAKDLVGLDDLLEECDPYDLFEAMEHAFKEQTEPQDFIEEMFAEDLASLENDRQMEAEALEYEEGYDED